MKIASDDWNNELKTPWMKRYFKGLIIGMGFYAIFLVGSIYLIQNIDLGLFRIPIGLSPAFPIAYLVWSYQQALELMDEFTRHIHIRSIMFGAAVTIVCSVLIAFFENAGLPPLTFHVWVIMCGSWGLALGYNTRKYR